MIGRLAFQFSRVLEIRVSKTLENSKMEICSFSGHHVRDEEDAVRISRNIFKSSRPARCKIRALVFPQRPF